MVTWFDSKSQPSMDLVRRLMLQQELKIVKMQNNSSSYSSALSASPSLYRPLSNLNSVSNQASPRLSSTLMSKTLGLLEAHTQKSRLRTLASAANHTSLALEMARKQKQQQQQLQQQQGRLQQTLQNSNLVLTAAPSEPHHPSSSPITSPSDFDVIMGRGGRSNHHVGNERFRDLIRSNRQRYTELPKHEKIKLSRAIVNAVHGLGGRFLEATEDGNYVEAPDKRAVEKTSQCLREKRAEGRHGSKAATAMKVTERGHSPEAATSMRVGTTSMAA